MSVEFHHVRYLSGGFPPLRLECMVEAGEVTAMRCIDISGGGSVICTWINRHWFAFLAQRASEAVKQGRSVIVPSAQEAAG